MGLRMRKSKKIAPGVKLNMGKGSVGLSVGNKFGGVSLNSARGVTARASAPGTGISYSTKIKAGESGKTYNSKNVFKDEDRMGTFQLSDNDMTSLSDDEFVEYSHGVLELAKEIKPSDDRLESITEMVEKINREADRRSAANENVRANSGFVPDESKKPLYKVAVAVSCVVWVLGAIVQSGVFTVIGFVLALISFVQIRKNTIKKK